MKRACLHTCPRTYHFQIPVGKHGLLCHFRSLNWQQATSVRAFRQPERKSPHPSQLAESSWALEQETERLDASNKLVVDLS